MTGEEIEKALKSLVEIDLTDKQNYDSCERLTMPKYNDVIHETIRYITRLKEEIESLKYVLDIANNRKYRKKFISQAWEKEMGNKLSVPDLDFIYELYFAERAKHERFASNMKNVLEIEKRQIRTDTAKEIFKNILDAFRGVDYYEFLFEGIQAIADDDYGITIMQDGDTIIFEVDDADKTDTKAN